MRRHFRFKTLYDKITKSNVFEDMIKQTLFLVAIVCLAFAGRAEQLSEKAKISLLTCDPGKELYSVFGHSAIKVYDPVNKIDKVYNYGTFDFNVPGFYSKFIKGKLNYKLSVTNFEQFKYEYIVENRTICEQYLNLTSEQKQELYNFLENNSLPGNCYYLYDFLFDNCASRIRDVTENVLGDKLQFHVKDKDITFREMLTSYLQDIPWWNLGIQLILGLPVEKKATPYQYMFLPDYLKEAFDKATVKHNSEALPLVSETKYVFKSKPVKNKSITFITPSIVFWSLFLAFGLLTFVELRKKQYYPAIDIILFVVAGLFGGLLLFMWFGTDHKPTYQNLNLLWAIPFHLPMVFFTLKRGKSKIAAFYFFCNCIILLIVLFGWAFLPQHFHIAVIPLLLILLVRSYRIFMAKKQDNVV